MKEEDNNINNNSFENTEINTDSNQIINNDSILKKNSFMIISSIHKDKSVDVPSIDESDSD